MSWSSLQLVGILKHIVLRGRFHPPTPRSVFTLKNTDFIQTHSNEVVAMVSLHKMMSVECAFYEDKSLQLAEGASFLQMLVIVAKAGFSDWSEASRPKTLYRGQLQSSIGLGPGLVLDN